MVDRNDGVQLLVSMEAENYVQALTAIDIRDIGSPRWYQQHEYLEKLNVQAVINASKNEDEFVKEFFTTFDKVSVLIQDLITTEVWRLKVFPEIVLDEQQDVIFPLYSVLYHEAVVANLLETLIFHQEVCESAGDTIVDLVDYCYRKLIHLSSSFMNGSDDDDDDDTGMAATRGTVLESTAEELKKQEKKLSFDIAIKTISIFSCIINHLSVLPLSCSERILNIHDVPLLFAQLIELSPWTREKSGKTMKYDNAKWKYIDDAERCVLIKTEAQVWMSVFQLLLSAENQKRYELNSYRRDVLLRLRPYLTEILIDQMPVLIELRNYLDRLMVGEAPSIKKDLILEQVAEIWDRTMRTNEGNWADIARSQSQSFFSHSDGSFKCWASKLAQMYCTDTYENLITDPPKCATCGSLATKRCSRCANEWYCSRECQVTHWPRHKQPCNLMHEAKEKINENQSSTMKK